MTGLLALVSGTGAVCCDNDLVWLHVKCYDAVSKTVSEALLA